MTMPSCVFRCTRATSADRHVRSCLSTVCRPDYRTASGTCGRRSTPALSRPVAGSPAGRPRRNTLALGCSGDRSLSGRRTVDKIRPAHAACVRWLSIYPRFRRSLTWSELAARPRASLSWLARGCALTGPTHPSRNLDLAAGHVAYVFQDSLGVGRQGCWRQLATRQREALGPLVSIS